MDNVTLWGWIERVFYKVTWLGQNKLFLRTGTGYSDEKFEKKKKNLKYHTMKLGHKTE